MKLFSYTITSEGRSNSFGGGGGEVVARVEAANREEAVALAFKAGVKSYNGQYLRASTWRELTADQRNAANEASVLLPCPICGREFEAWELALLSGFCNHD